MIFFFSHNQFLADNLLRSYPQNGAMYMIHLFSGLEFYTGFMLVLALFFVLFYEAINGFHDTANSIATVIYTRALRSQIAVVMSGFFNFLGVLLGGLSVAYAIVHLLPTNLLLNIDSSHGLAMVFSLLLAAIIWNFGTWYVGLPASSSHTLIGAIIGIALTNALVTHAPLIDALNLSTVTKIFLSLLLSPLVGLAVAGFMIFLLRRYWNGTKKRRRIHMTPAEREKVDGKRKPPFWTRIALIISAAGVSFSHGANDGQKGIGLLMLVLIGLTPTGFLLNMESTSYDLTRTRDALSHIEQYYQKHQDVLADMLKAKTVSAQTATIPSGDFQCDSSHAMATIEDAKGMFNNLKSYESLNGDQRAQMRRLLLCISDTIDKVTKLPETNAEDKRYIKDLSTDLLKTVEYAPLWIIVAVALALSLGTMIGWKRVAITIGEKIGKKGMTYAQGVAAQMTAAISIGIASYTGMPVSTTHVLSSAVAGTMIVDGGGVQKKTIKNILLAWVLTLPITISLSGILYWLALTFIVK